MNQIQAFSIVQMGKNTGSFFYRSTKSTRCHHFASRFSISPTKNIDRLHFFLEKTLQTNSHMTVADLIEVYVCEIFSLTVSVVDALIVALDHLVSSTQ